MKLHHDPHGDAHPHAPHVPEGTAKPQRWSWGDVFDVEIPGDWIVEPHTAGGDGAHGGLASDARLPAEHEAGDHVHLVELYPTAQASTVAHIALLEPAPPVDGPGGLADLIRTFAAARGVQRSPDVELAGPLAATPGQPGGVTVARATFDGEGGRWVTYAATWGAAGAWMTACGHADEEVHLQAARSIFESLTPREVLAALTPEEDGSF